MSWPIRILLIAAVAFTIFALTACGGGDEPLDAHPMTTQPIDCGGGVTCR